MFSLKLGPVKKKKNQCTAAQHRQIYDSHVFE